MALVTLSEYAAAHGLRINNVRTARNRGKFATAVKQHGVWLVDDADPFYSDTARGHGQGERDDMIRRYAACGDDPQAFGACLDAVPAQVRDALPAQDVAAIVDALHHMYTAGYADGQAA